MAEHHVWTSVARCPIPVTEARVCGLGASSKIHDLETEFFPTSLHRRWRRSAGASPPFVPQRCRGGRRGGGQGERGVTRRHLGLLVRGVLVAGLDARLRAGGRARTDLTLIGDTL